MRTIQFYIIFVIFIFAAFFTGCATVSFDQPKSKSLAIKNTGNTTLGKYVTESMVLKNGLSGFYPLKQGMDALGARLKLSEAAEKSIDLQYFLMKDDTAGAVMTNALLKSADRGVRIRFLLDDVFTTVPDRYLLLMNQHPNIEIRIFNPISRIGIALFNYLGDFRRANRRMHNKSFTVDNSISVVGGRNIADEYFQLKTDAMFVDFDILAVGPIAVEISKSFDDYWNHSRAVPIEQFIENRKKENLETVRENVAEKLDKIYDTVFNKALNSRLLQDIMAKREPLFTAEAKILADSPDKVVHKIGEKHMRLARDFRKVGQGAEKEVIVITPYYVPGDRGIQQVRDLTAKGVRVVIITNSLASNNHVAVHSAYMNYRRDVIQAGAELYEARANAALEFQDSEDGPDTLTLHTKAIFIDRRKFFVGSVNLDPRSIEINTEMGLLIHSGALVRDLIQGLVQNLTKLTFRVRENEKGKLEWHGRINDQKVVETKEPQTNWWRRFTAWFLKIVPESQL